MFELDFKPAAINLTDTVTRREESYHKNIFGRLHAAEAVPSPSVDRQRMTTELGVYDWHRRANFLDHFLAPDTTLDIFATARYRELGDFANQPYTGQHDALTVELARDGHVWIGETHWPIRVRKVFSFAARGSELRAGYSIKNLHHGRVELWFGIELLFALLAGNAPDRYYEFDGFAVDDRSFGSTGSLGNCSMLALVDKWLGVRITVAFDTPVLLWRFPILTVSQSESGYDLTYQSSILLPSWQFALDAGESREQQIAIRLASI